MRLFSKTSPAGRGLRKLRRYLRSYRAPRGRVEAVLRQFARRRGKDVFFVQIGANDGKSRDPLYDLVTGYGWAGILVEPMPENFARLRENYRNTPSVCFENVAIAKHDGETEFWWVEQVEGVPPHLDRIGSLSRELAVEQSPGFTEHLVSRTVPCLTPGSLLRRHDARRLDLLYIDAQGADFEILKQVDLRTLRPELIVYESAHLSADDQRECLANLEALGYRLEAVGADTIAINGRWGEPPRGQGGLGSCPREPIGSNP